MQCLHSTMLVSPANAQNGHDQLSVLQGFFWQICTTPLSLSLSNILLSSPDPPCHARTLRRSM